MLILSGERALSQFRSDKLLNNINKIVPKVEDVSVFYNYFVDLESQPNEEELKKLKVLLNSINQADSSENCTDFWVIPRKGTRSPWSTKATEVAQNCGLSKIRRIERGVRFRFLATDSQQWSEAQCAAIQALLYDPMIQQIFTSQPDATQLFANHHAQPLSSVPILAQGADALVQANSQLGLGLPEDELQYLVNSFTGLQRDPTDAELMMFAQVNSEHCRHKIFNAEWTIDGVSQDHTLFGMIRHTHQQSPEGVLSAYSDNGAVIEGHRGIRFYADVYSGHYKEWQEPIDIVIKVETHNHPTAISPFPGAATGSGGEIRDEGATGRGGKPKAGLCGFSVSHLRLPELPQPWEECAIGKPQRIASPLEIMIDGPIGAAAFNNEFGRPNLLGYFRNFEIEVADVSGQARGYHKPIMIAGGMGNIRRDMISKQRIPERGLIIQIGGPGMLIGLGGGAASSVDSGHSEEALDFASVQRENPEMQRRCQEVIDRCWQLGEQNPILSIHDVGAGGLSNAVPEIIHDCERGGRFNLNAIPIDDSSLSPMAIWCNESQERYVLAIDPVDLERFSNICARERCPFAVLGEAQRDASLLVQDEQNASSIVDLPMSLLFGKPPKMHRDVTHLNRSFPVLEPEKIQLSEALESVLQFPAVACKNFLITIGDRSVTGLVARDQMVGPWQIPVADVAVTLSDYRGYYGEAMAMGERTPLALLDSSAAAAMAVGEALTNIAAAPIRALSDVRLSANWMAAAGQPGEDAALYDAVKRVGMTLCPELGIAIPVGKDSLSMRTQWSDGGVHKEVSSPVSLIVSAFAPVTDARKTLTPQLNSTEEETLLVLVDLAPGHQRLGGSVLSQIYSRIGGDCPDLQSAAALKQFFTGIQQLNHSGKLLAYHDRSDGGLWAAVCEMAFAAQVGVDVQIGQLSGDGIAALLNEELGAVVQIRSVDLPLLQKTFADSNDVHVEVIGQLNESNAITVWQGEKQLYQSDQPRLCQLWRLTSYHMQKLRDEPHCAKEEFRSLLHAPCAKIAVNTTFDIDDSVAAPYLNLNARPQVAILREQGVNGQVEMAAAFHLAGFDAIDVHMTDLLSGRQSLASFKGLVACGGFSYGDVLGAGGGWAKSILFHSALREEFGQFFHRADSFALGVCNGCQMMSQLKELIPGAAGWPTFVRNRSEQFEARLVSVEVTPSPSIFFTDMAGSHIPVVVAHGEGQVVLQPGEPELSQTQQILRYVNGMGEVAHTYPANPNGSVDGLTGFCNQDGRFTIMMPHPERVFRAVQYSWCPKEWGERSPWMRFFDNARCWVD